MKRIALFAAIALTRCAANAAAEPAPFPQSDLMPIGVYYYPEAWPSNQWARDIANI